jgi:hypothetical protein
MKRSFLNLSALTVWLAMGCAAFAQTNTNVPASSVTNAPAVAAPDITNDAPPVADANSGPEVLDLDSFKLISQRNIFNPNRSPRRSSTITYHAPRVDSFTLVGTLSYEKGKFAIFDGSSSEFRRTLKPADSIAGYQIKEIGPDSIILGAASNRVISLPVGNQMKRPEGGLWTMAGRAERSVDSDSTASSSSSSTASASTDAGVSTSTRAAPGPHDAGADTDIIRRLMLKRQSEK